MRSTYKPLGECLIERGIISRDQLEEALALQRKYYLPPKPADTGEGVSSEDAQVRAHARMMKVDIWHSETERPLPSVAKLLPSNLCRSELIIPLRVEVGSLVLAMVDPGDLDTIDRVAKLTKMRVKAVVGRRSSVTEAIDEIFPALIVDNNVSRLASEVVGQVSPGRDMAFDNGAVAETAPIINIVNKILSEGIKVRTSDIHIEPYKDKIQIRYRVDGHLQRAYDLPIEIQSALVARIKIMAEMDIVEHRIPQDGHLSLPFEGRSIDIRVSVLPNHFGERIVLRVLDKSMTLRTLTDLGFADRNFEIYKDLIQKPWGIMIVTGPTGSGKTTTLYAAINQLKEQAKNILTCEDPVEYEIEGISQSQVHDKVGLTLASLLRSLMRQDPDVILVGEIRDRETAETAIRAALTGHLVLSTMHSNDAIGAIPRLIDMGIEPLLLSSAMIGITAQRLVRVLCPHCREQGEMTPSEQSIIKSVYEEFEPTTWRSVGCDKCDGTGFKGRTGVHEILPITPEMQRLISLGAPPDELKLIASVYGFRPMQADACDRILAGVTTIGEVQRSIYFDTAASQARHQATAAIDGAHLRLAA